MFGWLGVCVGVSGVGGRESLGELGGCVVGGVVETRGRVVGWLIVSVGVSGVGGGGRLGEVDLCDLNF